MTNNKNSGRSGIEIKLDGSVIRKRLNLMPVIIFALLIAIALMYWNNGKLEISNVKQANEIERLTALNNETANMYAELVEEYRESVETVKQLVEAHDELSVKYQELSTRVERMIEGEE